MKTFDDIQDSASYGVIFFEENNKERAKPFLIDTYKNLLSNIKIEDEIFRTEIVGKALLYLCDYKLDYDVYKTASLLSYHFLSKNINLLPDDQKNRLSRIILLKTARKNGWLNEVISKALGINNYNQFSPFHQMKQLSVDREIYKMEILDIEKISFLQEKVPFIKAIRTDYISLINNKQLNSLPELLLKGAENHEKLQHYLNTVLINNLKDQNSPVK